MRTGRIEEAEEAAVLGPARIAGALALIALIFFSSTQTADRMAQSAWAFYARGPADTLKGPRETLLHHVAEKCIHFVLFFSLGAWLAGGLRLPARRRIAAGATAALVVGILSETIQIFTGRDAAIADVILNAASGLVGAVAAAWLDSAAGQRAG